jgi:hypothetical protein
MIYHWPLGIPSLPSTQIDHNLRLAYRLAELLGHQQLPLTRLSHRSTSQRRRQSLRHQYLVLQLYFLFSNQVRLRHLASFTRPPVASN